MKAVKNVNKYIVRPLSKPLSKMSDKIAYYIPPEDAIESVDQVFDELEDIREILTDHVNSTVRLVMNAEKMSIKETMRALTYLNLYGFKVDMVLVNKLLDAQENSGYLEKWKGIQQKYLGEIEEGFSPLPVKKLKMYDQEIVGVKSETVAGTVGSLVDASGVGNMLGGSGGVVGETIDRVAITVKDVSRSAGDMYNDAVKNVENVTGNAAKAVGDAGSSASDAVKNIAASFQKTTGKK